MITTFKPLQIVAAVLMALMLAVAPFPVSAGDLLVYTALEDDEIPRYLALLKQSHPEINVKIVRDSTGIVTAKLLAEKDNPQADVVWGTAATSLMLCNQAGMVQPYAPKGLERVRPKMRDAAATPSWVGIKAWMTGFCVNTVEAKALNLPVPASFADLTQEIYQGQLAMPNPASSGTGFLTVSAILQMMGEEKGWSYLDRLDRNIARYTHSGSKPCKLAGAGELPIGISFAYRGFMQKQKGEPVLTVFSQGRLGLGRGGQLPDQEGRDQTRSARLSGLGHQRTGDERVRPSLSGDRLRHRRADSGGLSGRSGSPIDQKRLRLGRPEPRPHPGGMVAALRCQERSEIISRSPAPGLHRRRPEVRHAAPRHA